MERFDALDKEGHKLGFTLERSVFEENVYIGIVSILVFYNNKILVTKRHPLKTYPLEWEITGGVIKAGEDYLTATKRELKEETNLEIAEIYKVDESSFNNYYCFSSIVIPKNNDIILQDTEVIDYAWLEINEFFEFISNKNFVQTVGARIKYLKNKYLEIINSML